ncbi:hypothetical protein CPB86DRAFT_571172 [Serendipita vermifera]|nr:hypothetical protein CPB86DRAFT_571172 [Serendipita vermifera]
MVKPPFIPIPVFVLNSWHRIWLSSRPQRKKFHLSPRRLQDDLMLLTIFLQLLTSLTKLSLSGDTTNISFASLTCPIGPREHSAPLARYHRPISSTILILAIKKNHLSCWYKWTDKLAVQLIERNGCLASCLFISKTRPQPL